MIDNLFRWLEGIGDPFPVEQPEKPPDTLLGFLIHYSWPFWPLLLMTSVFAALVAMVEVGLFAFVGNLVDWLGASDPEAFWSEHRAKLIAMGVLVLIVLPLLKFAYETVVHQGLLGNFAMRTRWQAHRYLLRQSVEFFQDDFAGRVATKMMQTALAVREVVMKLTEVLIYIGVYFTAAMILFASSDLRLSAPMVLWLAGYLIALRYFIPRLRDVSMAQAEARSAVTGRVVDSYTNIGTVKMFAHAAHEDDYARASMGNFLDNVYQQMRLSTLLTVTLNWLNAVLLFSVAAMSIWLWHIGTVSTGSIAFAVGLVLRLQGMSQWILWEIYALFENIGVVQDGIQTISRDRKIVDDPDAPPLVVREGKIRYDAIQFNYGIVRTDIDAGVIDDFSLTIHCGEKIGLVGRSGSGKSTLVSLLLRFYDLEEGTILIDDQDISGVQQDSLRSQIGMVTQDTSLLHRSVMDNIRYGKNEAMLDDVVAAAKQAHAHEFITGLVDVRGRRGYEAHVGERGVKLSGGQRQRVAIARVLLKNAPILVLDEATSALDSEVEAAIQENLYSLMQGKTVIAIAHRLSTIAAMDRLVVMDAGKIVEQGTHEQLLCLGGHYANLWAHQSGGFLTEQGLSGPNANRMGTPAT
jgi:ATP-binding cassette subfamily B multidrug efflux pump